MSGTPGRRGNPLSRWRGSCWDRPIHVEERYAPQLAWAREHVTLVAEPTVRERGWSLVLRLPTADGPVWLKQPAAAQRHEVGLYGLLVAPAPWGVLRPIAADVDRGLLLLPDGGPSAAEGPPERIAARVAASLGVYARLQRALAPHRAAILATGVIDASPAALPARFAEAAALAGSGDRSDDGRRRDLVAGWACDLAGAPGADLVTVDHQDLHPGHVLDGGRVYDWGDAVLAHPFASLLVALGGLARTLGVTPEDPAVRAARDAYLAEFADLADHATLVATAETACRAALVARALTWHRAVAADPASPYADAPRATLARVGDPSPFAGA